MFSAFLLRYRRLFAVWISILLACLPGAAAAEWQYRGYASQSYSNTSDPVNYGGDSVDGSFDIRDVGVNLSNDSLIKNTRIAGQVTYREFGAFDDGDLELDFLVVDYTLFHDLDSRVSIEAGRLKTNFGFYLSGWDVAHARPFALLPITLYQEGYRELFYSADAIRFNSRFYKGGYWTLEIFFGRPAGDADKVFEVFRQDTRFDLDGNFLASIVHYESETGLVSGYFGYGAVNIPAYFQSLGEFAPADGKVELSWTTAGLKINYNALYVLGEVRYGKVDFQSALPPFTQIFFPDLFDSALIEPVNYYIGAGYRVFDRVEVYTYFGEVWSSRDDKDGVAQANFTGVEPYNYYLRTVSAGVRWDVTNNIMAGAQWHRSHGTIGLSSIDNDSSSLPEQWDMLNLIVSINF